MNGDFYILDDDGNPVPCNGLEENARWMAANPDATNIAQSRTIYHNVSTVFLCNDHRSRFLGKGPPILFETMVFEWRAAKDDFFGDNPPEESMHLFSKRYATRAEALKGHDYVCQAVINFEKSCIKWRENR